MSDAELALVRSAKSGDRAAFEELVRRTSRLLFARLYLETGDSHRAEDLLQETFLLAFRALHKLDDAKGFRSWLWTIAQNAMVDAARRDQRQKRGGGMAVACLKEVAGSGPSPPEEAARQEERGQVLAILRSLPEEYRLPLTLKFIAGADYETIQTQLGLTNGSLRGLLHRGLKILRGKLEQAGGRDWLGD